MWTGVSTVTPVTWLDDVICEWCGLSISKVPSVRRRASPRLLSSAALRSASMVVVYATPTAAAATDYHVTVLRSSYIIISSRLVLINPSTFHLISRVLCIVRSISSQLSVSSLTSRQILLTGTQGIWNFGKGEKGVNRVPPVSDNWIPTNIAGVSLLKLYIQCGPKNGPF